jgi:nicotinate (nicotinamide) nucleotide adenylyltransferase
MNTVISPINYKLKTVFGGTFDPPHHGHLIPLLTLLDALDVEQCDLIPSHIPVHKTASTNSQHRLKMTQLLALQDERLQVNDIEIFHDGPSYTAKTLARLQEQSPHSAICFVMGIDTFLYLHTWFKPQEIFTQCHVIVMMRPEYNDTHDQQICTKYLAKQEKSRLITHEVEGLSSELLNLLPNTAYLLNQSIQKAQNIDINGILRASKQGELLFFMNEKLNISSTMIRDALLKGESIKDYVSPEVFDYIQANNIYTK